MEKLRVFAFADEASPAISGQIAAMERNGLQGLEIRGVDGRTSPTSPWTRPVKCAAAWRTPG